MSSQETLDLKGLKCPLPVLKTRKALESLISGERLKVETTDPMAAIDLPHFCREYGHRLVGSGEADEAMWFLIEKQTASGDHG